MCKVALTLLMAVFVQGNAVAGQSTGKVEHIISNSGGQIFFRAGDMPQQPGCSQNAWAFDMNGANAAGGKAMLAVIIAAQAQGKQITVIGKGVCDVWGDRESVSYVVVAG